MIKWSIFSDIKYNRYLNLIISNRMSNKFIFHEWWSFNDKKTGDYFFQNYNL